MSHDSQPSRTHAPPPLPSKLPLAPSSVNDQAAEEQRQVKVIMTIPTTVMVTAPTPTIIWIDMKVAFLEALACLRNLLPLRNEDPGKENPLPTIHTRVPLTICLRLPKITSPLFPLARVRCSDACPPRRLQLLLFQEAVCWTRRMGMAWA